MWTMCGLCDQFLGHPPWEAWSFNETFIEHAGIMVDAIMEEHSLRDQRSTNKSLGCGEDVRAEAAHEQRL